MPYFFFFSSRRRHTRSLCDWSSDVCSSDLPITSFAKNPHGIPPGLAGNAVPGQAMAPAASLPPGQAKKSPAVQPQIPSIPPPPPPPALSAPGHVKQGGFIPPGQAKKSPVVQLQAPTPPPPP